MGIPALFRWLSQKYPKIISPVIEEQPMDVDGHKVPVNIMRPNPNGEEFDNLYLDMNAIVHPCYHPEDRPPPATEEEMMLSIFKYTDRVVNMVRPRKLLMLAVDGVAPRAKMNQQRSRRFRAAQEAKEKEEDKEEFMKMLKSQNGGVPLEENDSTASKKVWDSNAITPGTPFMHLLAESLRYWCAFKVNTDPAWEKVKVIISDASVAGEGEHKIMGFIRSQRSSPEHDPNTRHVIYGLDADLIMLGLATHEPHFRVLREDVFFQESKARTCRLCGQKGHIADECRGEAKKKEGAFDEKEKGVDSKPFIWLHVSVLREYLEAELQVPGQPFRFDLERALDDWVFMCFFVGNDFLPHLPSLDIRENGIDTLIAIWRDNIPLMGGYLTKDGHVDLERAQFILDGLAKQEDAIFRRRRQTEERKDANAKRRKLEEQNRNNGQPSGRGDFARANGHHDNMEFTNSSQGKGSRTKSIDMPSPGLPLFAPSKGGISKDVREITHEMAVNRGAIYKANLANKSAAASLKSQLLGQASNGVIDAPPTLAHKIKEIPQQHDQSAETKANSNPASSLGKRKADFLDDNDSTSRDRNAVNNENSLPTDKDEAPPDTVRLWEEGYADRYYEQKFRVHPKDIAFRNKVARAYVEGLAWVLLYYFQACPSWTWYYPYHYAPFAADFVDLGQMAMNFETDKQFKPYEQLMAVLPAASNHAIPEVFRGLMTDEDSDILDFYPKDFPIDLNGKKFAWQGVALLPFIDAERLLKAMADKYPLLSAEEVRRNEPGKDVLIISDRHPLFDDIASKFYSKRQLSSDYRLDPYVSEGLAGRVEKNPDYLLQSPLIFPLPDGGMPHLDEDHSISLHYEMPRSDHIHKSMLLRGVKFAAAALNRADVEATKGRASHSGRSHGGAPSRGNFGSTRGRGNNYHGESRPNPFAAHVDLNFIAHGAYKRSQPNNPSPTTGTWGTSSSNFQSPRQGPLAPMARYSQAQFPSTQSPGYLPPGQHYGQAQPPPPPYNGYNNYRYTR